jgi:glycine cleavage system H protein
MASSPSNLRYTKDHEWARLEGERVVIGVTSHAQEALGDVVYVELPKEGDALTAQASFGVIESTKAVSELYAPLAGKVVKVNSGLADAPHQINEDPYGDGWICEIVPTDRGQLEKLMDAAAYDALVASEQK